MRQTRDLKQRRLSPRRRSSLSAGLGPLVRTLSILTCALGSPGAVAETTGSARNPSESVSEDWKTSGAPGAKTAVQGPPRPDRSPVFQKGITFTHGYRGGDNMRSQQAAESLEYLRRELAVEWIALNPFGYQASASDTRIRFRGDPPDEHLARGIRDARARGFRVMLKPHIWLRHQSDGAWRGTIGFETEEEWASWFADYERFILHYARIAAETETDIFCIGVELSRTVRERPADWRRIIARVRGVYPGPLTYAANWWEDYDVIEIWDELDYMGINAFFPISQAEGATDTRALAAGARAVADQIEVTQRRMGKPVLLTEVGFRSVRGSTVRPWEWPRRDDRTIDLDLQARAYGAVLEAFWEREWFSGLYWWKWHSDLSRGGARNNGFTPRGKPAEEVVSDWYRRPAPRP